MDHRNPLETSSLINKAHDKARENNWIEAAEYCQQALNDPRSTIGPSILPALLDFSAECHLKAAFHAKTRQRFEELVTISKQASEKANTTYSEIGQAARSQKARSRMFMTEFWLEKDSTRRARLAPEIVSHYQKSARALEDSGETQEALRIRLDLLKFFREFINLATDFQSLKTTFDQAAITGKTLLDSLRGQRVDGAMIEALAEMVWLYAVEAQVVMTPPEFGAFAGQTRDLLNELGELSRDAKTPMSLASATESAGHVAFDLDGDPVHAMNEYIRSLEIAKTLGNTLDIGRIHWVCSQTTSWLGYGEYDPVKRQKFFKEAEAHASDSIRNLEISFQTTELSAAHTVRSKCLIELANLAGSDLQEKKNLLQEAVEAASRGLQYESATWAWSQAAHNLSKALYSLSRLAAPEPRRDLLRESLSAREKATQVNEKLFPLFWNNVAGLYHLALVRIEMATCEGDLAVKMGLLTRAVSDMELCLKRGKPWGTNLGFLQQISEHNETYGDTLSELYAQTSDVALAHRAIKAHENAINILGTSKSPTIARLRWKIARIYENTRGSQQASIEFKKAADNYHEAASIVPGSASLFQDLGYYLDAWSVIETARWQHDEGEYASASEYYSTAARFLAESREWAYLSSLFTGRSLLEKSEGLSSEEKSSEAMESFSIAIERFQEAEGLLDQKLKETSGIKEKQDLDNWLEIAHQRESYCLARLQLEEARDLDKKGDKTASARKFRNSSETLTTLLSNVSDVQERTELESLAKFCDGWARMKEAEARASPEIYSEAAEAFLALRSVQTKGQFLHLALANAAICKALGAGTIFQQTRDVQYYSELKKQTEAAAEYFRSAGFKKTEAWTRATQRLFDSLIFITDAESESDPVKKRELYHFAENHLKLAARLFGDAGFPTRKEETLSHLERIREEKQILLTPLEALSQIPTATAASLSLSPRGRGQPTGAERFDEAYVVGDLNISQRELPLGTSFPIDIEIVNVGKAPATLVKLQNVLPESFELADQQNTGFSPEGDLDLKGRNLEHLKTYTVKFHIKATRTGPLELRPRLFYMDDLGTYKTYRFQPTTLTVLDVGLGSEPLALAPQTPPGPISIGKEFRFDTERSRKVFQYMIKEFLIDYMSKRIYVDKAGWRTLVQIVREVRIPRSALYGPRGRDGPVLAELERRGLVESRIFPKERGRGGAVKRVRVAYDNAIVKRIVERSVIENR